MMSPLKVFSSLCLQLLVVSAYLLTAESAPDIPSFVKICHRNDTQLSQCIRNSIDSLKPHLKVGVPSFHLESCDPLRIPHMTIEHVEIPIPITTKYTDIRVWGVADFQITDMEVDPKSFHTKVKLHIPRLKTTSNYEVKYGYWFPKTVMGEARRTFTGIDIDGRADFEFYVDQNDQQTHLRITNFSVVSDLTDAHINLVNSPHMVNAAINQSLDLMVFEMVDAVGTMFKEVTDKVLADHSWDTLFPL